MKKYISLILSVLFLLSSRVSVYAEEEEAPKDGTYTYKITISTGADYGKLSGASASYIVPANAPNPASGAVVIVPDDSKYYFKGWHIAGIEDIVAITNSEVREDLEYVASYGIKGDTTKYTINYVIEGTTTTLAEPKTFVANVGDKPVVAALYFEGYEPQARALTQTLVKNEADNEFTFYYHTPNGGAVPDGGTTYTYIDEGGTISYITVPGGGGGGAPAGGGGAPAGGGGAGPAPAVIPDDQTPAVGPADIIDLDEDETPAGGFSPAPTATSGSEVIPEPGTPGGGISNAWKIALATGGGIALLLLLLLLLRRRDNSAE